MAINVQTENVAPLAKAARWVPPTRTKNPHPSTLWRWHTRGVRGCRLEVIRIGGTTCTSREALERFFARCSGEEPAPDHSHREREIAAADARLKARGL